ncbi:Hypothetical predicted protein [Lecanosticta acicola]|uniref:DUF7730 domain-containing protein n=1 Tax=Lecanosticta acicola TaxID=111012 RepID=A0AAI9EB52_9PEZI|nr:Hypothetical predicted protein [Lecanosticta acicola]
MATTCDLALGIPMQALNINQTPAEAAQVDFFERFPPVLLNKIYEQCFKSELPIRLALVEDEYGKRVAIHNTWEVSPPMVVLLATCQRIHSQAVAHLYSDNTFTIFNDTRALTLFVTKIKRNNKYLRKINLETFSPVNFTLQTALPSLRHRTHALTSLTLTIPDPYPGHLKLPSPSWFALALEPWMKECVIVRQDAGQSVSWQILNIIHFVPVKTISEDMDQQRIAWSTFNFDTAVKMEMQRLLEVQQEGWKFS